MRNFVILFDEKEGTSALVQMLDQFRRIAIVRQVSGLWEPFDRHNCGSMSNRALRRCLEQVYGDEVDMDLLNRIYTRTAKRPLSSIPSGNAVGFKMRFRPKRFMRSEVHWPRLARRVSLRIQIAQKESFRRMMIETLRHQQVQVLLAVRQNVFRWALSMYHGDGSGRPGHLQFRLAAAEIRREDIPMMTVDCERFETVLAHCERLHDEKRSLVHDLTSAGIPVEPVRYEEFLNDKPRFFTRLLDLLEVEADDGEIDAVVQADIEMRRVHAGPVSEYVTNYQEVEDRFGQRFVAW